MHCQFPAALSQRLKSYCCMAGQLAAVKNEVQRHLAVGHFSLKLSVSCDLHP